MIITKNTLDAMYLCNKQRDMAYEFIGDSKFITLGVVFLALEKGLDAYWFVDYWLRGPKGMGDILPHLLWIYDEMIVGIEAMNCLDPMPDRLFVQAKAIEQAMSKLWINKRWAI